MTDAHTPTPTPLPCGCVRGSYLCPTAERLWRRCNGAWYEGNDDEAARLRELYEAHFEQATTDKVTQ